MLPHFIFNVIILQQDVDDDCQELQQPRHETEAVDDAMDEQLRQPQHEEPVFVENENVGNAMDEQLHQPQHENETVDDAMDEHLRKYCQELVMVSVTKSK